MNDYDLHTHTTASDGLEKPEEVVRAARAAGLSGVAITDHDTTAGLVEALEAGKRLAIDVVPGVEVTCDAPLFECHVLGYFLPAAAGATHERLLTMRRARIERAREILRKLGEVGVELTEQELVAHIGPRAVQRPHIARVLVAKGYAETTREAMRKWLARGAPAWVPAPSLPPEEAIAAIREDGGVAVLAHPGITGQDSLIPRLAEAGLCGLEVDHPAHDAAQSTRYRALCEELGLIATGGSDYHGSASGWHGTLGACRTSAETVAELRARSGA